MPKYLSYYELDDGRIYSLITESFIEKNNIPEDATITRIYDQNQKNTIEALIYYLSTSGYNIPFDLKTIEEVRAEKLAELNEKWLNAEQHGKIDSSLGFKIDATERSLRDVNGLIDTLTLTPTESVRFCDANNEFHEIDIFALKKMKIEILTYGQELYQKKWLFRENILNADSKEKLTQIDIQF